MAETIYPAITKLETDDTTAFLRAARSGNLEKVVKYLDSNLDINIANSNGLNALHLASKDGHVEIVTELLKRGAKVDAATKKGNTALHIASLAGQVEVVNILIQYSAAVNTQSQNGFTPLYMAAQENHDQVVKLLLSNGANQSLATEDGFTPLAVAMQQGHDKVVSVLLENDLKGKVRLPALHIAAKKDDCKAADLLLQNDHKPDVTSKSGFTPLHIAAHYGNEEIGRLLIKKGADVNYLAKHNISPLHVAAKWGKNNMVKLLLENSAMIDAKTRDGLTPLHCAARSGHEEVVSTLLEHSAPISARTKNGLAPLHMASQGDHVDAARVLLYHRAPVDEVTIDYLTSLHVAAHCGHVRVAKLLLDRKADPNARALNGFTPLHIACKKNRIKIVELLLKHGASIESTTESGLTPLHVASFMGCMNIVIFLLQHEANPDVPTVRGETPLHLAARANQTDIIRILLRNGAKVDARAREDQTPLHIASRLGNVDIVMLLLQHGAAVDITTKDMYTALHIAAKEGQEEVAAILVENHASVKATTKNGFTPLHIAAKYGNMNVAKILLLKDSKVDFQGKNDITPLHLACHYDHPNVANMILEKGASPHLPFQNGHTPLHIAARKNQMDIASTLLEHGADPNAQSKAGFTPLHLSAQKGHYDMTNLLIEHGADPNHKAKNGLTALHLCAQEDSIRVASVLVKNGANIESETESGYRPIHVASHFGNVSIIRFLLKHNAQIDVRTKQNYTPLHQAAQQGHAHVVTALLEGNASHTARTTDDLTPLNIAQKLGYISVMEVLKGLSYDTKTPDNKTWEEKYKVIAPESLQETCCMSDSDDEGVSDGLTNEQPYRYLTADLMKSLRDDSLPIDVTRDDPVHRQLSKEEKQEFVQSSNYCPPENFDSTDGINLGFFVSFLVDARGGTMKGCRYSGIRIIVPPRRATMPIRVTCRLVKPSKVANPPALMEGEALATRIIEMGPVGATFLGPVLIDIPHFASVHGKEREIIILRSETGETWKEHDNSHENDDTLFNTAYDTQMSASHCERITRIITTEFPQYFAIVTRIKQEIHVIGADGGILISSVASHVQAVFPPGALTKKIKVGLQAHVIPADLTAKLLGNGVAVSPVITIEPRRRKFHKPITLTIPVPQAASKGMINQYGGETPTLRLLCSIAGGTSEAQWEDVTGSTPLTFLNNRVSFTTTVSARFWLMDCRNISEVPKMATDLYKESLFVPFITNFVIYTKRFDVVEATLRILCMTGGKDGLHTLEKQEEFLEIVKSRDVETLDGKDIFLEFSGNLVPVTKSGQQLKFTFKAFRQNRLSFHVKVKDPLLDPVARMMFMRDPRVAKGEPAQQPICVLNIVLPEVTVQKSQSRSKLKEIDSEFINKMDMYKSTYMRDYGEKHDIPKSMLNEESKKIIDEILQKKQKDAGIVHESLTQNVAPLESVDASNANNIDEQIAMSPNLENQTYSEKLKFWEDITKKRDSYQRSESEISRASQLTINESDSECMPNLVSEENDLVLDEFEITEDINAPDISECTVAEKAHYFEEQIQKENNVTLKSSFKSTVPDVKKTPTRQKSLVSQSSISEIEPDSKSIKHDKNVLESQRLAKDSSGLMSKDDKSEKDQMKDDKMKYEEIGEKQTFIESIDSEVPTSKNDVERKIEKEVSEVIKETPLVVQETIKSEFTSKLESRSEVEEVLRKSKNDIKSDIYDFTTDKKFREIPEPEMKVESVQKDESESQIGVKQIVSKIPTKIKTDTSVITDDKEKPNILEKELDIKISGIPVLSSKNKVEKLTKVDDELDKAAQDKDQEKKKKSGIPKRIVESSVKVVDSEPGKEDIVTVKETKITETVSQHYQKQVTETKSQSQTVIKTYSDPKDTSKMFEETMTIDEPEISTVTSKIDLQESKKVAEKEVISSEILRDDEKILKHEERGRELSEKLSESTVTTERENETLEDKISYSEKLDKNSEQEVLIKLSDGKQTIDATASEVMKLVKDEKRSEKVEDSDAIVIQETEAKSLKERKIDTAINLEKNASELSKETKIDITNLGMSLEDELKATVIREESREEYSNRSDINIFPSRENTEDISREEPSFDKIPDDFKDSGSFISDEHQARNIAEDLIQSIEEEIVKRSESSNSLVFGFEFDEDRQEQDDESNDLDERLADDLNRKFESIMKKDQMESAEKIETVSEPEELLEKDSTRNSLSISEDITKEEDFTSDRREKEEFLSGLSQTKLMDRDITISPISSISDQIDLEESLESEKQQSEPHLAAILPGEIKVAEEYLEEPQETVTPLPYESTGARVLQILEPGVNLYQDFEDDAELDKRNYFQDEEEHSLDEKYLKDVDFNKLHESPAMENLDKICTDQSASPRAISESSMTSDQSVKSTIATPIETITKLDIKNIDKDLIPSVVSPRLKVKELEIQPVAWTINNEKIEIVETLEPSQAFDKELDEFQLSLSRQQSLTSSDCKADESEIEKIFSEDVHSLDLQNLPEIDEPIIDNEIDSELVENKLDISCQELVATLQREYDAKTPTNEDIPITPRRMSDEAEEFVFIKGDTTISDQPISELDIKKSPEVSKKTEENKKHTEILEKSPRTERPKDNKPEISLKGYKDSFSHIAKSFDDSKRHSEKIADAKEKLGHGMSIDSAAPKLKKEDLANVDLSTRYAITVLDQVVKREIAEVKESLEAAKQDLIEELSENNQTVLQIKDSPSEFQFKLEPEPIPNDLPFLYKEPSVEQITEEPAQEEQVISHKEDSEYTEESAELEKIDDESKDESFVDAKIFPSEIKVDVQSVEDTTSVPVPASRSSSDVEYKEDASSSLSIPPQPVPRRRHKPSRVSKKIYSESEGGSSSGESSNYQSCDYESGSRPSSSDVEALQSASGFLSATASEYETALMSVEHSTGSKQTSQEYQSAVSTLSSRESMKSLNSLSSGHLGSIDSTSELTETLVASEPEMDKEEIDENLELALDEDVQDKSTSSESEINHDEGFDNITGDIPTNMKRSSEMIFPQHTSEGTDSSLTSFAFGWFDEDSKKQSTKAGSSINISEDDDLKTSTIDIISDQISCIVEGSSSSPEIRFNSIEAQSTGDDIDLSELKMTSASATEDVEALLLSKRSVLQQASMSTSSTSGMSVETVIERERLDRHSPDSDSFELVDKPDIIDDFVVIEEVGREAKETDAEGKSILITSIPQGAIKKFDRDVENLIAVKKDENGSTSKTVIKNTDVFNFESEESPPQMSNEDQSSQQSYSDDEIEAKKWMEMQFQADARAYELECDRGPLEDIKEEEITDFEAGSSRFGSLGSHKGSLGSSGSMKGSYGSTTEYDVLAGKKMFAKSIEHDNISMSSLQEFENLENAVITENSRRLCSGSQDSVNNGSLPRRYISSRSGHGDDVSVSSLKDFEGLEKACKEAHIIELRAREEEDLLEHESPENRYRLENLSKAKPVDTSVGSFNPSTSGSDDYEKRIMEIDEIIRLAQANVEKLDRHDDTTEDISQIEITDVEKIESVAGALLPTETETAQTVAHDSNVMETSTDSLEMENNADKQSNLMYRSSDSLELKTTIDFPSLSYSDSLNNVRESQERGVSDQFNSARRISSDSLEAPILEHPEGVQQETISESSSINYELNPALAKNGNTHPATTKT